MEIKNLRENINSIDDSLIKLLSERMEISKNIAQYKKDNALPVYDSAREQEILNRICDLSPGELEGYMRVTFNTLFQVSRSYQLKNILPKSELSSTIDKAVSSTDSQFPERAAVACQGGEGAYSRIACEKMFILPSTSMHFDTFESVFKAVDAGLCRYGVLPLENSTSGSVNEIYDLMSKYRFYIVRSLKLSVDHALLAPAGVNLSDVKEIFSHPQAISQCSRFLSTLNGVKITECVNTADASKHIADSGRCDVAAISSKSCAKIYGLSVLSYGVQNTDNNKTRFICISKKPEIYPGADKTSLMLSLDHRPGALYSILSKFNALSVNITKIESRPIEGRDFEFMFYFDLAASVYSEKFIDLICELENELEYFRYLGSYSELV